MNLSDRPAVCRVCLTVLPNNCKDRNDAPKTSTMRFPRLLTFCSSIRILTQHDSDAVVATVTSVHYQPSDPDVSMIYICCRYDGILAVYCRELYMYAMMRKAC